MVGSDKPGSQGDSESQGSLQGDVCVADPDSVLKSGCFDGNRVFQKSVAEELKVLKLHFLYLSVLPLMKIIVYIESSISQCMLEFYFCRMFRMSYNRRI